MRLAVAADPMGDGLEAERRAIASFGDPHLIAAQFAVVSLAKRSRRVGAAIILVIAGVFVAMKARVAWYAVMESAVSDDLKAVSGIVGSIDRYSFWLSVVIGIAAWLYISSRGIPAAFHPAYRRQLRRFFLVCRAAAVALIVSVISDAVLTALRFRGTEFSTTSLVSIVSIAIEIVCVGIFVLQIRRVALRATLTFPAAYHWNSVCGRIACLRT